MAWTTRTCLNRWCVRTLQGDDPPPPEASLQRDRCGFVHVLHPGQPPLERSCIAPYCDFWEAEDETHGMCRYRQRICEAYRFGLISPRQ